MKLHKYIPALILLLLTPSAFAVKIADITRMDGARNNVLVGMGLVIGLKGTGDGGAYLPAMRQLANMMGKFSNATSIVDLSSANNVAIVNIYATLPAQGVHNGDHLDVHVASMGAATSLKGGILFHAALMGPDGKAYPRVDAQGNAAAPIPYALATGEVDVEDPTAPNTGVVRGGGVSEVTLLPRYIDTEGRFTLIIDDREASWAMASNMAKLINEASETGENVAVAVDSKHVVVQIPSTERATPDSFIATVSQLPVKMVAAEARVLINSKTGTIVMTSDVEISPTVICKRGLTISMVNPAPVPSARNPQVITKQVVPLDTTNTGGPRLQDLASAFDQLKVPVDDRIDILKDLYKSGYLHAKLSIDGQDQQ